MKIPKLNLCCKPQKTRINSKKEAPKVVAYMSDKPIDTSISKVTLVVNDIYRGVRKIIQAIKKSFE